MARIYIIDNGRLYWIRQWINEGMLDHLVLTTEAKGAQRFTQQEAGDYAMQLGILGYDAHIDGGRQNGEQSPRDKDNRRPDASRPSYDKADGQSENGRCHLRRDSKECHSGQRKGAGSPAGRAGKAESQGGCQKHREDRDWCIVQLGLERKYGTKPHGELYGKVLVAWVLTLLFAQECFRRLGIWIREGKR